MRHPEVGPPASSSSSRKIPDPRHIITPDAFGVAPELLGCPLSGPWRRAAAMMVDLFLIALLSNAPGILFGFAAALVLFRVSARSSKGGYLRRSVRLASRFGGAVVLFIAVVSTWDALVDAEPEAGAAVEMNGSQVTLSGMDRFATGADVLALRQVESDEEAAEITDRLIARLEEAGLDDEEIEEIIESSLSGADPRVLDAAQTAMGTLGVSASDTARSTDSLAVAYSDALASDDTTAAPVLRAELMRSLAADTLAELSGRLERLESREDELRDELAAERERGGILAFFRTTAEDFGLGFGWAALYFTAFLALWRGQTPGKRLFGIRVLRLNGQPIGWWAAFGRFGGYAAGFATGLLGFFQVFWDPNRQAVHDKISETVVIKAR